MNIHINRNGQSFGPYKEATAREHLTSGALMPTDLAWRNDAEGWKPLEELLTASPPVQDAPSIRVNRNGEEIGPYSRDKAVEYFQGGQLLPTDWALPDGAPEWKPIHEVLNLPAPVQPLAFEPPQPRMGLAVLGGVIGGMIGAIVWVLFVLLTGIEFGVVALGVGALAGLGARIGHGRVRRQGVQLQVIAAVMGGIFSLIAQYLVAGLFLFGVKAEMEIAMQDKNNGSELSGQAYKTAMDRQLKEAGFENELTRVDFENLNLFSFGSVLSFMIAVSGLYLLLWTALAIGAGVNVAEREISWLAP